MKRHIIVKSKCCISATRSFSFFSKPSEWKNAISEAEKIVGYSTSLLSLRCLLSDEISNVATQMKKLVGTGHPLLMTAQKLFQDGKQSMQTRGLMVLLISKAAGPSPGNSLLETMVSGIYPSQRTLAEITEMIHTATLIHKSVVNLNDRSELGDDRSTDDMEFGNKMAVLSGDFLLANASNNLASLRNTKVVEMISTAIRDLMKGEFSKFKDQDSVANIPDDLIKDEFSISGWEKQTFLSSGSLLARGCQSALALAQHGQKLQDAAFQFGSLMALGHQFKEDLSILSNPKMEPESFNLSSVPIIIYLNKQQNPSEKLKMLQNSSVAEISKIIAKDRSVVEESKLLGRQYGSKATELLTLFGQSDARNVLANMVRAVTNI